MGRFKTMVLLSYLCIASISATIITPALLSIEGYFSLSHGSVEWVVSIFLLGYVLGQLIYGPLSNRFGRLRALRMGLVLNIIGIIICLSGSSFASFSSLLVGRFLCALGSAAGLTCTFILINELLDESEAKRAMSYAIVSFTVGIGLAVSLGGFVSEYWSFIACFWVLLAHAVLMFLFTYLFKEPDFNQVAIDIKTILSGYRQALSSQKLLAFSLCVGLCSAISYGYAAAAPIYSQHILHLSESQYGFWNALNMIGMAGSGFAGVYFMKRYSPITILKTVFMALLPMFLLIFVIYYMGQINPLWFFLLTTILYFLGGLIFPAASFIASRAIPCKANASGMMSFINMCSAMLGVIIMGYLPFDALLSFGLMLLGFYAMVVLCVVFYQGSI